MALDDDHGDSVDLHGSSRFYVDQQSLVRDYGVVSVSFRFLLHGSSSSVDWIGDSDSGIGVSLLRSEKRILNEERR